ncbi:MAG: helix-turn-helix domain-containing protein [Eggerthellaceae bacterium]|nr:helix-turn-helix domain-containing protein [Eggerthellaceae bacterium]MBQ9147780.1 helix-turn-helix domain-containing protein [Rikenellaceae bacterium]
MLCTTQEVADALRVTPATIYRMMSDGRIPQDYITKMGKGGKEWRFNLEGIERHLLAQYADVPRNP